MKVVKKLSIVLAIAVSILCQNAVGKTMDAPVEDGAFLKGIVIDADTGEPLIGAAIMVSNTTEGVVTDLDGGFAMNLLRESTSLEVSYIGYTTVPFVVISDGRNGLELVVNGEFSANVALEGNTLSVRLAPDGEMLENAVVTGRKNLESLQALRNERITSGFAIENIGSKEMSIKGISNAQESVVKLSGISVASAGQLIVRGLGDRYSTTTLNGLPIASPNPDNKLIPLDIFPASTIQNITVSKVYEASSFADYSGAHVDISTKEGQSEDFFRVSFSTGGLFRTLGRDFYGMDSRSLFVTPRLDKGAENVGRLHLFAIYCYAIALFKFKLYIFRLIWSVFGGNRKFEHFFIFLYGRIEPRVFQDSGFVGNMQHVPIHGVWLFCGGLHVYAVLAAIFNHLASSG